MEAKSVESMSVKTPFSAALRAYEPPKAVLVALRPEERLSVCLKVEVACQMDFTS